MWMHETWKINTIHLRERWERDRGAEERGDMVKNCYRKKALMGKGEGWHKSEARKDRWEGDISSTWQSQTVRWETREWGRRNGVARNRQIHDRGETGDIFREDKDAEWGDRSETKTAKADTAPTSSLTNGGDQGGLQAGHMIPLTLQRWPQAVACSSNKRKWYKASPWLLPLQPLGSRSRGLLLCVSLDHPLH